MRHPYRSPLPNGGLLRIDRAPSYRPGLLLRVNPGGQYPVFACSVRALGWRAEVTW